MSMDAQAVYASVNLHFSDSSLVERDIRAAFDETVGGRETPRIVDLPQHIIDLLGDEYVKPEPFRGLYIQFATSNEHELGYLYPVDLPVLEVVSEVWGYLQDAPIKPSAVAISVWTDLNSNPSHHWTMKDNDTAFTAVSASEYGYLMMHMWNQS